MACKGHSISWSLSLLRVYKLEILIFKLKISSLQTRNFEFTNSKFWVWNSKCRVCKLEAEKVITKYSNRMSLTSHRTNQMFFLSMLACVASVSVGFQSRESFDNFAAQEMGTSEKMELGGRGEGNERNACQQRSVVCKTPPSSFCRACQLAALQWPRHLDSLS